ncbi:unnamed protein product [Malus baccata var. baccata]
MCLHVLIHKLQLPVAIFPVHMPSMQLTLLFPAPLQGNRIALFLFLATTYALSLKFFHLGHKCDMLDLVLNEKAPPGINFLPLFLAARQRKEIELLSSSSWQPQMCRIAFKRIIRKRSKDQFSGNPYMR